MCCHPAFMLSCLCVRNEVTTGGQFTKLDRPTGLLFFISIHPNLIAGNHNQVTLIIKSNGSTENEIYLCIWYHLSIMICHELWKSILRYHGHDGLSTLGASSSRGMILTFIYSSMCIHLVFLIGMLQLMLCPWALFIFFCLIYLHGWGEPICCII